MLCVCNPQRKPGDMPDDCMKQAIHVLLNEKEVRMMVPLSRNILIQCARKAVWKSYGNEMNITEGKCRDSGRGWTI